MAESTAPSISIIIPTYNRPGELRACLAALESLDYDRASFEVVVVDDGTASPLNQVAAGFEHALQIRLLRQANAGPAAARNHGASQAKGDWLVFIDDDCAPAADYLSRLADRIVRTGPECAIGGRTVNALAHNIYSTASQMLNDYLYDYYNADPRGARFLTSNNMSMPARVFQAVGGFDPQFRSAASEDRDICDRLLRSGRRIIYAPEAIVYHSHDLTFRKYWRQHVAYGRGASVFHRTRDERLAAGVSPEPLSFYVNLVRYPVTQRSGPGALALTALMVVAQAATAIGLLREWLRQGLPAARQVL